jgi:hypothetical protein
LLLHLRLLMHLWVLLLLTVLSRVWDRGLCGSMFNSAASSCWAISLIRSTTHRPALIITSSSTATNVMIYLVWVRAHPDSNAHSSAHYHTSRNTSDTRPTLFINEARFIRRCSLNALSILRPSITLGWRTCAATTLEIAWVILSNLQRLDEFIILTCRALSISDALYGML